MLITKWRQEKGWCTWEKYSHIGRELGLSLDLQVQHLQENFLTCKYMLFISLLVITDGPKSKSCQIFVGFIGPARPAQGGYFTVFHQ